MSKIDGDADARNVEEADNIMENEEAVKKKRNHFYDTLNKHGYISQRVVNLTEQHGLSIVDLQSQNRLFDNKKPVVYYESIGMQAEHEGHRNYDELRPDIIITVRSQTGENQIRYFQCSHTGYLFNHSVYSVYIRGSRTKYGWLFRNERKQRAILFNGKHLDGCCIDMIFNVLDRGDKPANVYDRSKRRDVKYVSKLESPVIVVFNDKIDAPVNELHRFYMRFGNQSSVIGYLEHAPKLYNTYELTTDVR